MRQARAHEQGRWPPAAAALQAGRQSDTSRLLAGVSEKLGKR